MRIVVVGAGKVGYYLLRTLIDRGHEVSLVEINQRRCQTVAEEMGILTVNGDGIDLSALVDAGADRADVLAAVTGMDESNLVICQLAKRKLGVRKVAARVNNPKNREVLQRLGVDVAVSGTALIADGIEEEILHHDMHTLLKLQHSKLSLVEMHVTDDAPAVGRAVRDLALSLPKGCVLVSITRKDEVILPRGGTMVSAKDSVLALVHRGDEGALHKVFLGRSGGDR